MRTKKPKKTRAKKYEKKVVVKATFDEIIVGMLSKPKKRTVKKQNRKPN